MNETERMKELVKKLNEAAKAYYQEDREIMSNLEYDTLYDEMWKCSAASSGITKRCYPGRWTV